MTGQLALRTRLGAVLMLVAAAATLAAHPAPAQSPGGQPASSPGRQPGPFFVLRAYYLGDSFSNREARLDVDTFTTITYRGKPGGGLDFEFLPTAWLGIDFAASQTHIQADEVISSPIAPAREIKGNIQLRPFTVGVFAHPFHWERADFYIGPYVGIVTMSGSFRPSENKFGYGSALGFDFRLGSSGLAITALGRILTNRFSDQLRPVSHYRNNYLFGGGLSYRW
jgi:hypothetical protein